MNNKGIIRQLVFEIIAMVLTVVFTIPIWNSFEANGQGEIAKYYDNYYYVLYNVKPLEDKTLIMLSNDSYTNEEYNLVMKVKNNNKVNLNNIVVNVNGEEKALNNYKLIKKGAYNYIVLDNNEIVADSRTYDVKVYDDNLLDYSFEVLENI